MKRWIWIVGVAAVALVAGCGLLDGLARGRPEWRKMEAAPADYGLTAETVSFKSSAGLKVSAWWIATPARAPRATIVLVHGVNGNRSDMLPRAKFLVAAGYDVLTIDLRAHGDSEGNYPSPGYLEAAEVRAAATFAAARSKNPVVLLGYSYGGVAVLHAASSGDPVIHAVIADSAFVSYFAMMGHLRQMRIHQHASRGERFGLWLASSPAMAGTMQVALRWATGQNIDVRRNDLLPVLPRIMCPVLFITGDQDELAPSADTAVMLDYVPGNVAGGLVQIHATHNTYKEDPKAYEAAVLAYLARVIPAVTGS